MTLLTRKQKTSPTAGASAVRIRLPSVQQQRQKTLLTDSASAVRIRQPSVRQQTQKTSPTDGPSATQSTSPSRFTDSASQTSGHDEVKRSQLQPPVAMSQVTRTQGNAEASAETSTASALASTSIIRESYEIRTTRAPEEEYAHPSRQSPLATMHV
ncbi:hypothetical protein BDD12DRAFT_851752 [Trichophaea hybrida]|nr:hypothetical protein BDD12DRAFT_851752 [Trichophaea hybrida]